MITENIIKGLTILNKYSQCSVSAEHDTIYAGPARFDLIEESDKNELSQLGWVFDEYDGWLAFV